MNCRFTNDDCQFQGILHPIQEQCLNLIKKISKSKSNILLVTTYVQEK